VFLITELTEEVKYTVEEVEGKKNLYIEGVYMQAGIVNRNQRIYPVHVLANECARYNKEYISNGRGFGELGHPAGPGINLDRISHIVTKLEQSGNDFHGKARIASTPMGDIARGIMESGGRLGVSSRGLGTLKQNSQGIMEVQGDFRLAAAADIVADPSAPNAFVKGIMEGVEFVRDEAGWRAVEVVKEEARRMTRRKLEEESLRLFRDFLRNVEL
jgi:Kyanoviridae head maturation protease